MGPWEIPELKPKTSAPRKSRKAAETMTRELPDVKPFDLLEKKTREKTPWVENLQGTGKLQKKSERKPRKATETKPREILDLELPDVKPFVPGIKRERGNPERNPWDIPDCKPFDAAWGPEDRKPLKIPGYIPPWQIPEINAQEMPDIKPFDLPGWEIPGGKPQRKKSQKPEETTVKREISDKGRTTWAIQEKKSRCRKCQ